MSAEERECIITCGELEVWSSAEILNVGEIWRGSLLTALVGQQE
jgi:hypothetical protein